MEYSCEEFMKKKLKMNDNKKLYFRIDSGTSTDQIFALLDNVLSDSEDKINELMNDFDT